MGEAGRLGSRGGASIAPAPSLPAGTIRPRSLQRSKRDLGAGNAAADPVSTSRSVGTVVPEPQAKRLTTRRPNPVLLFSRARTSLQRFAIPRFVPSTSGTMKLGQFESGTRRPCHILRSQTEKHRWPSAGETHRQEYALRVARGAQKGLSRSAARGHPRAGERAKAASMARSIRGVGRSSRSS